MVYDLVKRHPAQLIRVDLFRALDFHEDKGRHVVLAVATQDVATVCDWLHDAGLKVLSAWSQQGLHHPDGQAVTCILARRDPA